MKMRTSFALCLALVVFLSGDWTIGTVAGDPTVRGPCKIANIDADCQPGEKCHKAEAVGGAIQLDGMCVDQPLVPCKTTSAGKEVECEKGLVCTKHSGDVACKSLKNCQDQQGCRICSKPDYCAGDGNSGTYVSGQGLGPMMMMMLMAVTLTARFVVLGM